jgi:hypothetical protein
MLSGRMLRLLTPLALVLGGCFLQQNADDVVVVDAAQPPDVCGNGQLEGAEDTGATVAPRARANLPPVVLRP